jgi:hypothetical protein
MRTQAKSLRVGDVVSGFGGNAKVTSISKGHEYGLPKALIDLKDIKTGRTRGVSWGWNTTISVKSYGS